MNVDATYSVHDGRLRISTDAGITWEGLPDGMSVLDLSACADQSGMVVLLDPPPGYKPVRNLVKIGPDASVLWRAQLPTAEAVTVSSLSASAKVGSSLPRLGAGISFTSHRKPASRSVKTSRSERLNGRPVIGCLFH